MEMPYDPKNDLYANQTRPNLMAPKAKMTAVTASATDFTTYSLIYATGATSVTYLPVKNTDGVIVTESVSQGWVSPVVVRNVSAIGVAGTIHQLLES
jgi:hypothetical protein